MISECFIKHFIEYKACKVEMIATRYYRVCNVVVHVVILLTTTMNQLRENYIKKVENTGKK